MTVTEFQFLLCNGIRISVFEGFVPSATVLGLEVLSDFKYIVHMKPPVQNF